MGFLDRVRSIFKEQEIVKEVELSFEELISQIHKKMAEQNSEITENAYEKAEEIKKELESLSQLICGIEKLEPEGIMPGSRAIKERFCSYSKQQIASIEKPSKDLDEIMEFLNKAYSTVHNLGGLTQRQIVHIEFFFKEDFRPITKKAREISDMIDRTREIVRSRYSEPYRQIKNLHEKMKELDRARSEKSSKMALIMSSIERLKTENENLSGNIAKIDVRNFKKYEEEISELENKKSLMEQEISSFLSVEKLLKKLVHEKEIKNELLGLYIKSPVKALLSDKDMKIVSFVKDALELHEKGGIEVDQKKIEKAVEILNSVDYLKRQKKELSETMEELEKKKEHMQNVILPEVERKARLENEKVIAESDMKKLQQTLEAIPKEIAGIEKEKASLKEKIAEIAPQILGTKVRIK